MGQFYNHGEFGLTPGWRGESSGGGGGGGGGNGWTSEHQLRNGPFLGYHCNGSGGEYARRLQQEAAAAAAAAAAATLQMSQHPSSGVWNGGLSGVVTSGQVPTGISNESRTTGGSRNKTKKPRRRIASLAQRRAANIRERRRMFNLNEAFDRLRPKVPTFAYEKRLSRIETLKLAISYIAFMRDLLDNHGPKDEGVSMKGEMFGRGGSFGGGCGSGHHHMEPQQQQQQQPLSTVALYPTGLHHLHPPPGGYSEGPSRFIPISPRPLIHHTSS